jgi:undecaprenyl-diphosphatase
MTLLQALILGIIQGLTEFIPISSTAHLTMAATWLGVIHPEHPEQWTAFMATIQLGTLAAVLAYFRRDVLQMTVAFFTEVIQPWRKPPSQWSDQARLTVLVILGTVPIVVIGVVLKKFIEGAFTKDLHVIGVGLILIALALWWAEKRGSFERGVKDLRIHDALAIGLAQVLALIPGASRSGSTIMAGLFRGLRREDAARFSFLLSIPAIMGAGILAFVGELKHITWSEGVLVLAVATGASLITGYASIAFLLRFLRTKSTGVFVVYRLAVGALLLMVACTPDGASDTSAGESRVAQNTKPVAESTGTLTRGVADTTSITNYVSVTTSVGRFRIGLYGNHAPLTVRNFIALVKKRYYDRVLVHRVVPEFVIQLGDPNTRDPRARGEWGKGGATATGSPLPEELDSASTTAAIGYATGVVAMARRPESGTGSSQFFVCLEKAASLPYIYTIFGRVIDGMEVVRRISDVEVEPGLYGDLDPTPRKPIIVRTIRID